MVTFCKADTNTILKGNAYLTVAPQGNHLWHCATKCFVLNVVFTFMFSPSPLTVNKCNRQWLNSALLSSILKFWVLAFNYICPNQYVFLLFYGFICDFLEFLPKFSLMSRIERSYKFYNFFKFYKFFPSWQLSQIS